MSSPKDCCNSEEKKSIAPDDKTKTKCDAQREGQPLPASDQHEVSPNKKSSNEAIIVDNNQCSEILTKGKSTPAGKEKCSSGSSDISSAKKKRAPCPWQVHPPPRPFKKARFAWQIKNYEHTVSRMKKAVAQQQQQHHQQTGQTSSSYSRNSAPGNDASDDPGEVTRPLPPGSTHYPGIYSNLQTTYPSSFYNNPLMRWSKLAASTVDSPVNRMLHNLFFSGNEPPPDLHSLLMLSLAEGNAAALTENMNCEDLPSNLPVEALSAALSMPQSQLHQQSALHNSSNLSSPGMQSPPTSDYDSSSDDASLGDDIVPEPQVMPPSSYQQHLQHAAGDGGQHHPSYGPGGPQQCQANCPGGACPLYSQDSDLPSAIPASRKLFLQHQQNLEQSHLNSPENTNANIMFQNAMMNCPIGMTNRNLFNFQLQSFCERMQASNALLPFPAYQQHFPPSSAHLSEYMDSQDEDGDCSPAELPLRRNFSPPGGDVEPTHAERADAEHDDVDHSQERANLVADVLASQPPPNGTDREAAVTGNEAVGAGGVRPESRNTAFETVTDDPVEDLKMLKGDKAGEDYVVAANDQPVDSIENPSQVGAVDDVPSVNAANSSAVSGAHDQNSSLSALSEDEPVCVAVNQATSNAGRLSSVDVPLIATDDHSTSESSDREMGANKVTAVTSTGNDSLRDGIDGILVYKTRDGSQASSVETSDEARAESMVSVDSGRTAAVSNAKNTLASECQPVEIELPASTEDNSATSESSSVVFGESETIKAAEVSSSPVNQCSASSDILIVAPVPLTVCSIVENGDSIGSSDAAADSLSLNFSGQTSEERARVVSPAIRCSSEYSRGGNSPTSSLAMKPKIGRNDCDSDSTDDTLSPSSLSSNSKCLSCVNGCDNCSNKLRDSTTTTTTTIITTENTTAETLGSTLCGNTTPTTPTTRSCSNAGRVTVVTCSCVIAKNRASDPPIVVARNVVSLATSGSNGSPALPVIRSSSAATANSAVDVRKEASSDEERQPTGQRALWIGVKEENPTFARDNNVGLVVYPSNREHWHMNMEVDEEELVEGEYDDDGDGPPPSKKRCLECSSFETCSTGGLSVATDSAGDVHLPQIPISGSRRKAGGVRTADLQHVVQNTGADDETAVSTPPPPLTAPALNDDEDPAAAGTTTTTTAAAVVHHMCDNNNDKYFLDQAFHLAIKPGLGYQKA